MDLVVTGEPYVQLSNGYSISAISGGSPCKLYAPDDPEIISGVILNDYVTGIATHQNFVIGESPDSYFLLDTQEKKFTSWPVSEKEKWENTATDHGFTSIGLSSPKNIFYQYRKPIVVYIYAILLLLSLAEAVFIKGKKRITNTEEQLPN